MAGLRGLRAGGSAPGTCSPGWWENVVVDINPGFSFAWSGLPLERGAPTEPSQPHHASSPLFQPVLAPCSADEARQCTEEDNVQIRTISWPGPACPWPAGCFFIALPVNRLEGEELAGPWEKEHPSGPCQPSGKGTARGISAQLLLGGTTPAQVGSWQFLSQPGLAVPLPALHLPVLAGGFCATHQPPAPATPYVPPAKEPPRWRAPATPTVSSLQEQ